MGRRRHLPPHAGGAHRTQGHLLEFRHAAGALARARERGGKRLVCENRASLVGVEELLDVLLFVSMLGPTEAQDAEGTTTPVAELVHRFTRARIDPNRLEQLYSQRHVPRRLHPRLFHVELPAHHPQARLARARDRCQQIPKGKVRTVGSLPWAAWVVVRRIHPWCSRGLRGDVCAGPPARWRAGRATRITARPGPSPDHGEPNRCSGDRP
jgi:hypothetical protein